MKKRLGQSTIEILIATGVFSVLGAGVLLLVLNPLISIVNSGSRVEASTLVTQGLEAARAIKERSWTELALGTHGLAVDAGNNWIFSGASDLTEGVYTRQAVVSEVYRDVGGDITETGGTLDDRTKKVTVTITWTSGLVPILRSTSRSVFFTDWAVYDWTETSDTDFNDGTPTNMRVVGTGDGAYLELDPTSKQWVFANGDLTVHSTDTDWSGTTTPGSFNDDTQAEFDLGTYVGTQFDAINSWLELDPTGSTVTYGEAGTFAAPANGGWQTVNFNNTYTTPVVVGTANTATGNPALVFEARNVTSTSADMRICESEGSVSSGCAAHVSETAGYLIIDAATANALAGIEAGTFTIAGKFDTTTNTVNYSENFGTAPIVLASVQTVAGTDPVEVRVTTTGTGSFTAGLCQQLTDNACDSSHVTETVGWIAIEPGNNPFDQQIETGSVGVSNSAFTNQTYGTAFSATPVVIVEQQTNNGGQDGEVDEAQNVTTIGVDVRYCELDSNNTCDNHTSETVGWAALTNGDLSITSGATGIGTYDSVIRTGSLISWDTLSWIPERPYYKELPDSKAIESGYPAGNAIMTGNQLLMHLNESAGATAFADASASGNSGTCAGVQCPTSGVVGKLVSAVRFDGQDNEVVVSDAASLDMTDEVTIEGWVNVAGNGRTAGEILPNDIDSLDFSLTSASSIAKSPDFVKVSGTIYAVAYEGDAKDGFVTTFSVDDDGVIGNSSLSDLEFDPIEGKSPNIINVTGSVFAVAYQDSAKDGWVKTFTIDGAGNISAVIGTLEFDPVDAKTPNIVNVTGNVFSVVYEGIGGAGTAKTFTIDGAGNISAVISTLVFDTGTGKAPRILNTSADIYAVVYEDAAGAGTAKTFTIDGAGNISAVIGSSVFDAGTGKKPRILNISRDIFAITYEGPGTEGFVRTRRIVSDTYRGVYKPDAYGLRFTTTTAYGSINNLPISASMSAGWNHVAMTYDRNAALDQQKLYLNGAEVAVGTLTSQIDQNAFDALVGSFTNAILDEVAVYDRALSATEIDDHYRRGAARLKYQIRTCNDAACSGEIFVGPDGTALTFFTELANSTSGPPTFNLNISDNLYYQYQATLETDNTAISPEVTSISGTYLSFSGSIGTFNGTEVTGTGEPASVRQVGTASWSGTSGLGNFFFHTNDTDFEPGTYTDTVMAGVGDSAEVQLDTLIDWRFFPSPTSNTLHDAQVISSTEGYAAGQNGTLLQYDGTAWTVMSSPTTEDLYDIFMTSSTDGWAVGLNGVTLRWNGTIWSVYPSFTTTNLWELSCVDMNNCWLSGSGGEIWFWNGTTWSQQTTPTTNALFDIAMLNTNFGWAAGIGGTILQWNGSAWSTVASPVNEDWRDIAMLTTTDGFISGPGGNIIKWDGASWTLETTPTTQILRGVTMLSPTFAFAVGNLGTILRWDGASWITDVSPSSSSLKDVQPVSSTEAWAVGEFGEILRYGPHFKTSGTFESVVLDAGTSSLWGTASWTEVIPSNTDLTIATRTGPTPSPDGSWSAWSAELTAPAGSTITSPGNRYLQYRGSFTSSNPDGTSVLKSIKITYNEPSATQLNGVNITSASDGWAVGNSGVILRYDGSAWGLSSSPTSDDLNDVSHADANTGWAVGAAGRIIKWNGSVWANETSPTSTTLNGVDAMSTTNAFAVGQGGEIIKLTGASWSTIASPTSNNLNHVDMISAGDGFAVGATGEIIRWNGSTWSIFVSPTANELFGVEMVSSTDGWTVGASGTIARWNGSSWATYTSPVATILRSVSCASGTDCWAKGDGGVILDWDGSNWSLASSPTTESMRDVQMVSSSDGWSVGTLGTILRYANIYQASSTFESRIVDSGSATSTWDVIYWDMTQPIGTDITIATRSGPTAIPDGSWSLWSSELTTPGGSIVTSPDNQYFQYRATFTSSTQSDTALLNKVEIIRNAATIKNIFSVEGASSSDVWAVGRDGIIVHYDGSAWSQVTSPIATDIYGIDAVNAIDVFAVGNVGKIIRYNGSAWITQTSPVFDDLKDVSMISGVDGFAVGGNGNGIIVRWNGTAWSSVTSPTTDELYSVSMIDANDGFAVGKNGRIIRWNGTAWSTVASPVGTDLNSVHMLSSTFGWAVGKAGVILSWNGTAWSTVASPANVSLNAVEAKNSGSAWAVGDYGIILEYAGGSWNAFTGVTTSRNLLDLTVFNPTDGWIVGDLGTIFKDPVVYPTSGQYLSSILNTDSTTSTFLTAYWTEVLPANTDVTVAMRTGNTATPDGSWSVWGSEMTTASGTAIVATDAQYLQYRAIMTTSDTAVSPSLKDITATFKQ